MPVPSTYLVTTRNLQSIIQSVANAKAPDRFNSKFLEDLGFKSSNDRLYRTLQSTRITRRKWSSYSKIS